MATSLPPDAPRPRLCLIRKRTPEEEYGFNLHAEKSKGQFIGAVDSGSPADIAGLRPGDRIVVVNGTSVINEPHKQVVAKIKENSLCCDLIVVDEETQTWYTDHKIPIPTDPSFAEIASEKPTAPPRDHPNDPADSPRTPPQPEKNHVQEYAAAVTPAPRPPSYQEALASDSPNLPPLRARLCKLIKSDSSQEFGFNLHAEKNAGHFIGKIDAHSIAQRAGLEEGQRIVGVNGVLIYPHTPHKDVVSLIKGNPHRTELLVASSEVDAWYKQNAQEYDFATAEQFVTLEASEHGIIARGVAQVTKSNGYSTNGNNGIVNGDEHEEPLVKETRNLHLESERELNDQRHESDSFNGHSSSPYSRSKPPPPIEPYESIRDIPTPHQLSTPQQPEWMKLSAAQLRERVGQHKKPDPRKEPLSLQQKHDLIRNM